MNSSFIELIKNKFLKDSLIVFLLKVLSAFLGILLQYLLTQSFSIDSVGIYNKYFSGFMIMVIIFSLGIPKSILSYTSRLYYDNKKKELNSVFLYAIKLQTILSIVLSIALIIIINLSNLENNELKLANYFILAIPSISLLITFSQLFKGTKKFIDSILIWSLGINVMLSIFLIFKEEIGLSDISKFYLLSSLLILGVVYIRYKKEFFIKKEIRETNEGNIKKYNLIKSYNVSRKTFYGHSIFEVLNRYGPILLLGLLLPPKILAIFATSLKIAAIISFSLDVANVVMSPYISEYFVKGKIKKLENFINTNVFLITIIMLPVGLVLIIFSKQILSIFGEEYSDGNIILSILIFSSLINIIFGPVSLTLQLCKCEKDAYRSNRVSTILLIALVTILVPFFGIISGCLVILFSVFLKNILNYVNCYKKLGIKIKPKFINI